MSARAVGSPPEVAAALDGAAFVAVRARADGDSLAAAGLVAAACRGRSVPFGVRVGPDPERPPAVDGEGLVVTVGWDAPGDGTAGPVGTDAPDDGTVDDAAALPGRERPASAAAYAAAREAGGDPDPILALAGAVAGGSVPGTDGTEELLADATSAGLARRPGIAVPTADLGVGLAASTRFRIPASGDVAAAREAVADVGADADPGPDADARRRLASLVATGTAAAADAPPGAATAVEAGLRPYAGGPLATLGGYADVLGALARSAPGLGVGLAIADDPAALADAALDAWREHGLATHRALDGATRRRYDGALVVETDAPPAVLPTAARVARQFRSAEPVVVAVGTDAPGDGAAGPVGTDAPGDGTADGSGGSGDATVPVAVSAAEPIGVGDLLADALGPGNARGGRERGGGRMAADPEEAGPTDAAVEALVAAIRGAQ